jgi:hypothetical protein
MILQKIFLKKKFLINFIYLKVQKTIKINEYKEFNGLIFLKKNYKSKQKLNLILEKIQ